MSAPTARHRCGIGCSAPRYPAQSHWAARISVRGRNMESCEAGPIMVLLARDLVPPPGIW